MNVKAHAKINLGLRVLRKREDGFHDIETIFHRINLFDELAITPSQHAISISSDNPLIPTDENNLCWKAVELLRTEVGTELGASIHLKKNIPIGAGLGGGSSDAAAVLTSLPKVWNVNVEPSTLAATAVQIGSDVPFFLHNRSAYAEGRGERLTFVKLSIPYWIVLITPDTHISTAWAYRELSARKKLDVHAERLYDGATCRVAGIATLMTNDFEDVVFEAYPKIADTKRRLRASGAAYALMSGSGSSVYGLFDDETDARRAMEVFRSDNFVSLTQPNFIPSL
jgi:4-diphosphocytidyl-2-C-methyl-D-erythritol kinase